MNAIDRYFAFGMIIACSCVGAMAQDQRVEHWLDVDNKVVRPGESARITWWCKLTPGMDESTTYQGHPATVEYVYKFRADLLMSTSVSGKANLGYMNYPSFYDNGWASPIGNNIYIVDGQNFSFLNPSKNNPVWVYHYIWTPQYYENAEATVTVDMTSPGNNMTVALEVPALGKFFPQCVLTKWTDHTIYEAKFKISDTPCLADCNDDDELNIDDFICFTTNFAIGTLTAGTDCDQNFKLTIDDFICFQTNFVLGC
jgi:hypothetical protein